MAKSKPTQRKHARLKGTKTNGNTQKPKATPEELVAEATALLETSQPEDALRQARRALIRLQSQQTALTRSALPALNLIGQIHLELGDPESARDSFLLANSIDPDGNIPEREGGGAEKFFWLAQLNEEGGKVSVEWFRKGIEVLRQDVAQLDSPSPSVSEPQILAERKMRLASALCGMAEVYMTDLSWEIDAEAICEKLVGEAVLIAPESPEALQTLASIRISQERQDEAQEALRRSHKIWSDLIPGDARIPDFPTRISLSRLLMEAGMEEEALEVLERLIKEDDGSVEAWYLGGWCLQLLADKAKARAESMATPITPVTEEDSNTDLLRTSRSWLQSCLQIYNLADYEDERLREHATELVEHQNEVLGPVNPDENDSDGEEWEDEDASVHSDTDENAKS